MIFKRYPDRCYAVVIDKMRGPCGSSKLIAAQRFFKSGLIASAKSDKRRKI